ncbi:MAG: transporter, ATP-binding/permease protein [Herbinix sp.]|jgi:ATP-binding cassette subfamily B protein|nr:transporter, ATP-binding/permease protein [Herbinix sp.]
MFALIKQLKRMIIPIIAVAILLVIQANCDLSLPAYTSDIVNVGIQQGGIDSFVPDVIRKTEMERLSLFMNQEDTEYLLNHYKLLNKEELTSDEKEDYLEEYPLLNTEELYEWNGEEEDRLAEIMSIPMMMVYSLEHDEDMQAQMKQQLTANMPEGAIPADTDVFTILTMIPAEGKAAFLDGVTKQFSEMPQMIINQTSITFVKAEYEAVGLDVGAIQTRYILIAGAKMLALALLAMVASVAVTFFAARIAARWGKELRSKVFHKVVAFSNTEMDKFSTASLITRSTNDIQQVQMLAVMLLRIVIYSPILAIGGIIKVVNTNNSMAWILAVGVGAIFVIIIILFTIVMPKFKKMQKLVDRINLVMREIITGLPVIRAFSTQEHEKKRFDGANIDLTKNSLFVNRAMTFMFPAMMLIMNLVSILIIWVGADGINTGEMQVGDMMAFIQYTMQIIMSFLMLTMVSIMLPRASVSAKRIDEILQTEIVIQDPKTDVAVDMKVKGLVEFKDVSFRYPNADEDVLIDINFTAKSGETTAIIGSTGSGKSTLINLIPRFYDVSKGSILVDGVDIRKMSQHSLRDKIGYVPQKGVLFSGTIESNIKFGDLDASEEAMKRAARIAQATEFIDNKPEGYQTAISEGGTNVSGGQKQRLSIARAIANDPEVYIFDDSFSALDYKTDVTLRKALKDELAGSTVIIVAQRISTIMNAEQILVLDEGRIVGKGTHKELLKNCDVYQQIAASQLSKEELDHE